MKIPKQEKIVMTYVFEGIKYYTVTRNTLGKYVLYKIDDSDYQKLKTSESPIVFDEIVEKDRSSLDEN